MDIILNEGTWFDFGDAKICLRVLNTAELRNLDKECTIKKATFKTNEVGQMQRVSWSEMDDDKYMVSIWKTCIIDWKGIHVNGVEFPCNDENKVYLMNNSTQFAAFVSKSLRSLRKDVEEEEKEEVKN